MTLATFTHVLEDLAEHLPGGLDVEEADDDPGVLPLQVRDGCARVPQETLPDVDRHPGALGAELEVVQGLEKQVGGTENVIMAVKASEEIL